MAPVTFKAFHRYITIYFFCCYQHHIVHFDSNNLLTKLGFCQKHIKAETFDISALTNWWLCKVEWWDVGGGGGRWVYQVFPVSVLLDTQVLNMLYFITPDAEYHSHRFRKVSDCVTNGAQDQQLGAEQDQLPCGSTETSSGSCQETETCMVRACHMPWQPYQSHPSGHLGGWVTLWLADEMLGGQHQSVHPFPCQNCSQEPQAEKDWKRISAEPSIVSPDHPISAGTELMTIQKQSQADRQRKMVVLNLRWTRHPSLQSRIHTKSFLNIFNAFILSVHIGYVGVCMHTYRHTRACIL